MSGVQSHFFFIKLEFFSQILNDIFFLQIDSLSTAIRQLETERNQLVQSLKEQRDLSDSLSIKVSDLQEEVVQKSK